MRLGVVYHTVFWRDGDGRLREDEGSFARWVDSLAPYVEEVLLGVPVAPAVRAGGAAIHAENVRAVPLPFFTGPRHFYPRLPAAIRALRALVDRCDVVILRVPTPAAWPAFLLARRRRRPTVLLVVGDLAAVLPTLPYRGVRRALYRAYVALEESGLRRMVRRSLTFTNGGALHSKHEAHGPRVIETKTTTIRLEDVVDGGGRCAEATVRLLCVCRVDPRKGLDSFPEMLAALAARGRDCTVDVVGPASGRMAERYQAEVIEAARRLGVEDRLRFVGAVALDELIRRYRDYDLFVLPTRPGEGIPRVLLEAMAAGLPVVTTAVAGIPSLVTHDMNGLLLPEATPAALADAVDRLLDDPALRERLIKNGSVTARAHTLEGQARVLMAEIARALAEPAA